MKRALVVLTAAFALAGCASSADVTPRAETRRAPRQFQIDYEVMKRERGNLIHGHLWNPYGLPARDIQLLVEGLDASGGVVNSTTTKLKEIVRSHERMTFSVPVPEGAERYRVSVVTYDLFVPARGR